MREADSCSDHVRYGRCVSVCFEVYTFGCAWGLRLCVWGCSFLLRTIAALCDGTVLCAVFPRGRRHKRRRLRRGCGAHRPNAAGLDCARDCCCGSMAGLVLRRSFRARAAAQWCLYPRPSPCRLPPHACGGGCRRRAYFVVICSPFSRFIRRICFIICASA